MGVVVATPYTKYSHFLFAKKEFRMIIKTLLGLSMVLSGFVHGKFYLIEEGSGGHPVGEGGSDSIQGAGEIPTAGGNPAAGRRQGDLGGILSAVGQAVAGSGLGDKLGGLLGG